MIQSHYPMQTVSIGTSISALNHILRQSTQTNFTAMCLLITILHKLLMTFVVHQRSSSTEMRYALLAVFIAEFTGFTNRDIIDIQTFRVLSRCHVNETTVIHKFFTRQCYSVVSSSTIAIIGHTSTCYNESDVFAIQRNKKGAIFQAHAGASRWSLKEIYTGPQLAVVFITNL